MDLLAFCSPLYEDVALNEMLPALGVRLGRRIAPGVFVLHGDLSMTAAVARSEAAPLTFMRQIVAGVQYVVLDGDAARDATEIAQAAPSEAVAVGHIFVCHPDGGSNDALDTLQAALRDRLLSAAPAAGHQDADAVRALAVVVAGHEAMIGAALCSRWPAGRPQFPAVSDVVSRAAFKLLEALDVFAIATPRGAQALDLGASPGGWTQILVGHGLRVVAVDPGALDPRVAALPGVEIHRTLAQTYIATAGTRFALIVDDMRLDARESAEIMCAAAQLLQPNGVGIMTFKLPERAPTTVIRQALAVLHPQFPMQQARCLYYNRHEITVCLRRQAL